MRIFEQDIFPIMKKKTSLLISLFVLLTLACCDCHKKPTETINKPPVNRPFYGAHISPACSPVGDQIAFWQGQYDTITLDTIPGVYLVNADGSNLHLLIRQDNLPGNFPCHVSDWSPDGNWLVYNLFWNSLIFKMRAQNGDSITCLTPQGSNYLPDWSPDGKRIVFDKAEPDSGTYLIWQMDYDGQNMRRISKDFSSEQRFPSYRNNGTEIACKYFGSDYEGLVIIDTTGTIVKRIFANVTINRCRFSPDGSKIAFITYDVSAQCYKIWCVNYDGTNARELTPFPVHYMSLDWTSDGRIVFSKLGVTREEGGLWIMNADGSNLHQLTFPNIGG
jgi:Tol biopolymer transport system component